MANIKTIEFRLNATRVVEQQTRRATLALLDAAEAEILDDIVENSKPPIPEAAEESDKLLYTPFRYPPLQHGSRFGSESERGIWYGALKIETAFAECSYYKFRFIDDSPSLKERPLLFDWTSFESTVATRQGVDLCGGQYHRRRAQISDPFSYAVSQALGRRLREANVYAIQFFSARHDGTNVAVFNPEALAGIRRREHWVVRCEGDVISLRPYDTSSKRTRMEFHRTQFLVGGRFPIITK